MVEKVWSRPPRLLLTAVLLCLFVGIPAAQRETVAQQAPQKPNILFILTDDQDVDSLSEMPNVKSLLAERGTTFSHAFATTPLCCPSRASMLRGQYAHNHDIWNNTAPNGGFERFRDLGYEDSTMATWLDDAGYETGYIGKYLNEYGSYKEPTTHIPPGWDRWIGHQGGRNSLSSKGAYKVNDQGTMVTIDTNTEMDTDYFARKAETFIRNQKADTPWFLVVAPNAPHLPALASQRNDGDYAGQTMPTTPNFNEADISDKASVWQNAPLLTDECPSDYGTQDKLQCIPEAEEVWQNRTESLRDVDDMVARLAQALDEEGFMSNTYVVYTSDNGWGMYKNRVYNKGAPYEHSQSVPFIVKGPGVTPGHVDGRLVANIDLAPTFADWARASEGVPEFVDGRSFAPILGNPGAPWRTRLLFEFHTKWREYKAVRTDSNQVYIEYPVTSETEYYDLTIDPYQLDGKAQTPPQEFQTTVEDLANCAGAGCRAADRDCSADQVDNDGDGVVDEPGEPCGDPRPPDTTIDASPGSLTSSTSATFAFSSSEEDSTFECSLDGAGFAACNPENNTLTSKTYDSLGDGEHTFSVRAIDQGGFADPIPASRTWTVDTTAPTIESVVPTEGATDISPRINVRAFFSETMDEASVEATDPTTGKPTTFTLVEKTTTGTSAPIPATVTYVETQANHKAILDPTDDLRPGATYVVTVTTAARDLAGNELDPDPNASSDRRKTWKFTVSHQP